MKVILRDDDTCYYTKVDELEKAFDDLGVPVTLSVIPFACYAHADTYPFINGMPKSDRSYEPIGNNTELVEYLKQNIENSRYQIAIHGFHHEYFKCGDTWKEETMFCQLSEQRKLLLEGKEYLEDCFEIKITEYVAPSNAVSEKIRTVLDETGLNTNSITGKRISRSFSFRYLLCYLKKQLYDLLYKEKYCGVMKYKNHKEIAMFEFLTVNNIMKQYNYCKKHNFDLVLFTHYWDLNNNNAKKEELKKFIEIVKNEGVGFGVLSDCF